VGPGWSGIVCGVLGMTVVPGTIIVGGATPPPQPPHASPQPPQGLPQHGSQLLQHPLLPQPPQGLPQLVGQQLLQQLLQQLPHGLHVTHGSQALSPRSRDSNGRRCRSPSPQQPDATATRTIADTNVSLFIRASKGQPARGEAAGQATLPSAARRANETWRQFSTTVRFSPTCALISGYVFVLTKCSAPLT